MPWILLTLLAAILWGITSIINKHVLSDELKDYVLNTSIFGIVTFVIFGSVGIVFGNIFLPTNVIIISLIAGVIFGIGALLFFRSLEHEEVSRVIPVVTISPVFVLILASIFLGEIFTLFKYAGIFLLIIGAVLISIRWKGGIALGSIFWVTLVAGILFASRDFLLKFVSNQADIISALFWVAAGTFLVSMVLFSFHHPRIREKAAKKGIEHLILSLCLANIGFFAFVTAISLGFVSLVSSLASLQSLVVFILAVILSRFDPKIIREDIRESTLVVKAIAIIMIVAGSFLVVS